MACFSGSLEKSVTGSFENAVSEGSRPVMVLLMTDWLSLQVGCSAFDDLAAPFEHLRRVVRQLSAFLVHLLAALQHFFSGVCDGGPALLRFLGDLAPRHLARSRRVEQSDGCSDSDSRHKPNYFVAAVRIRHKSSFLILRCPAQLVFSSHMASEKMVTVYRSMDATAKEDCETIVEILNDRNISAIMLDDSAPGVPEGTFEVQVPAADAARAEAIIAENPLPDEVEEVDDSEDLDLETIFHSNGTMAEVEAVAVKNVLEANGIASVLFGDSVLPNLGFEVKVARDQVENAR